MSNKLFECINKHPIWVVVMCIAFAIIATAGVKNLVFKSDYQVFFGESNPELIAFESMQNTYNKTDNVIFVVAPKNQHVFTPKHLNALKKLTKQSWQIPFSTRVDSLTNFQHTYAEFDDMIVENLIQNTKNLSDADLARIKNIALNEPLLANKILSLNGNVSTVNVTLQIPNIDTSKELEEIVTHVRKIKADFLAENPDVDVYLSGLVILNQSFNEAAFEDGSTLIPLMFVVVIVFIGLLLRTLSGTFATVIVIIISITSTLGIAGWTGFFITGPSASAPTIILTLAVADCIHVLTSVFYEMKQGSSKQHAIKKSLEVNLQPIFLTSITTAIGFLSMNFSDSPPFRDLGNIVAIGVMFAFVFSLTVFPALLRILPINVSVLNKDDKNGMTVLSTFVVAKRKILLPVMTIIIVFLSLFMFKNELNDDLVKYFDETVPYRISTDFMQKHLSGMTMIDVSIETSTPSGINNPEYLKTVDSFSQWLRGLPETDHVNTITDTLKRLNKNMHGDDPTWYKLPEEQELSAQYLLLYEMSLPYGLDLNNQLNIDKSASKVLITFKNLTSNEILNLEKRMYQWFEQNAPNLTVKIASPNLMFAHIGERSINGMLLGTVMALFLISILLGFALKSWRYGLISLLPNLIPAAVGFGIWGMLYSQVGMGLSVVVGMTIGIVVDDTVHFLSKYLRARKENGLNAIEAVHYAFNNVGRALIVTTLVLVAGFSILAQSTFSINAEMGLLTAITIFIALAVDFLFLPPLLIALDKNNENKKSST